MHPGTSPDDFEFLLEIRSTFSGPKELGIAWIIKDT